MRAEVVSMTADNLDMEAIRRGGDILKQGWSGCVSYGDCLWSWWRCVESAGFYENLCGEGQTFG